jgi:solute carrier family 25 oxoglutarate transporter 11
MVKMRLQVLSESGGSNSPFVTAKELYSSEGVKGFYRGIDSALLRQSIYSTLRLGIYFNMTAHIKENTNGGQNLTVL